MPLAIGHCYRHENTTGPATHRWIMPLLEWGCDVDFKPVSRIEKGINPES